MDFTIYELNVAIHCQPSILINFVSNADNVYCSYAILRRYIKSQIKTSNRGGCTPIEVWLQSKPWILGEQAYFLQDILEDIDYFFKCDAVREMILSTISVPPIYHD